MKYVILKCPKTGTLTPMLGVDPVSHIELAVRHTEFGTPVSAGFVQVHLGGRCYCFGHSETLNLDPGIEDYAIIQDAINNTLRIGAGMKQLKR